MRLACLGVVLATVSVARADPPRMLKGPYLQNLAPTSITVMWNLDQPAPAHLVVEGPGGPRAVEAAAARIGEATIDQLAPSSRYRYRVEIAGQAWDGEFATAPVVGAELPFAFVVMGDTRNGVDAHRRVVERVAQDVPDFVVGTGDMVDEGSREDQWQQFFEIERPLLRDNVYFPAVGNHDRQGRGRTADSYRALFSVPDNGGDTERYYAFSYATARILVLDSNEYSFALTDQTAWLERELIAARQDPRVHHIFAVMHHPPYSISLHGGSVDLRERWTPLFEKYQVSAVFSGHDHVYERAEHNGLHYFVSGGGGAPLYPRRPSPSPIDVEAVKKFERAFHYLRVTVTGARLEVTAMRTDGTVIETTAWTDAMPAVAGAPGLDEAVPPAAAAAAPLGAASGVAGAASGAGSGDDRAAGAAPPGSPGGPTIGSPGEPPVGSPGSSGLVWIGLGGVGLLLAAAVIVVRTLRR
ncbi:MAG TPA: metallophosphoesterase family protein [Kofleriaceae bacterium]|nr:metallophosphoesterase family protein [Kofleriaceae bacterium]